MQNDSYMKPMLRDKSITRGDRGTATKGEREEQQQLHLLLLLFLFGARLARADFCACASIANRPRLLITKGVVSASKRAWSVSVTSSLLIDHFRPPHLTSRTLSLSLSLSLTSCPLVLSCGSRWIRLNMLIKE